MAPAKGAIEADLLSPAADPFDPLLPDCDPVHE
jgi:hypothetical protein